MGLFKKYVSQTRKPEGILGKLMVDGMNGGHAKLADWGMSHLHGITPKAILASSIGRQGGRRHAAQECALYGKIKRFLNCCK